MKEVKSILILVPALLLVFASSPAFGQEAEWTEETRVAEGELLNVDPDAQVITVKTVDGTEVQFHYSDATEVQGTEEGIAGLAGSPGTQLRIHYRMTEGAFFAERIEVIG